MRFGVAPVEERRESRPQSVGLLARLPHRGKRPTRLGVAEALARVAKLQVELDHLQRPAILAVGRMKLDAAPLAPFSFLWCYWPSLSIVSCFGGAILKTQPPDANAKQLPRNAYGTCSADSGSSTRSFLWEPSASADSEYVGSSIPKVPLSGRSFRAENGFCGRPVTPLFLWSCEAVV